MITQEKAKELMKQGQVVYWYDGNERFKCWANHEKGDFFCEFLNEYHGIERIKGLWDYDVCWYTEEEFKAMEVE